MATRFIWVLRWARDSGRIPSAERDHPTCHVPDPSQIPLPSRRTPGMKEESCLAICRRAPISITSGNRPGPCFAPCVSSAPTRRWPMRSTPLPGEYGFASWPKLKTHLEALPQGAGGDGGGYVCRRCCTPAAAVPPLSRGRAARALLLAIRGRIGGSAAGEADRLGHATIATIHIVLALAGGQDAAASFLHGRGVAPEAARAAAAAGGGQD